MTTEQLYTEIAGGREDAYEWITCYQQHAHQVDDIVDGDIKDCEKIMQAFLNCHLLFNHPFYVANSAKLYPIIFLAGNSYCDSCKYKDHPELYKAADILRSAGNDVLILVTAICCPEGENVWERVRRISGLIREKSFREQH